MEFKNAIINCPISLAFGPPQRGYAFYDNLTSLFLPLELPPLPSAPPPMGRSIANGYR